MLDLASRRLLGYAMSERPDTAHIIATVDLAIATRGRVRLDGTLFHSDLRVVFEEITAAGIRYTSRIDASEECWAVFEATPLAFNHPEPVGLDDADLRAAARQLLVTLPTP